MWFTGQLDLPIPALLGIAFVGARLMQRVLVVVHNTHPCEREQVTTHMKKHYND